jgi:hypothetical protein
MSNLRGLCWAAAACGMLVSFSAAFAQVQAEGGAPQQAPLAVPLLAALGKAGPAPACATAEPAFLAGLGGAGLASGWQECGIQNHYWSACTSTPQCSGNCSHCSVGGWGSCYESWCAPYADSPGECPPGQYKQWVQHCTCYCGGTVCGSTCCPNDGYWCGANNRCCNGCAIGCPC